jgi:hypothetical protein
MTTQRQQQLVDAVKTAADLHADGLPASKALAKVATDQGFNQHELKLMTDAFNTAKTLAHMRSTDGVDKTASFELADYDQASALAFPPAQLPAKTASCTRTSVVPDQRKTTAVEKRAYELTEQQLGRPVKNGRELVQVLDGERGALTMFRQILAGLEAMTCDVVYFAEHDVLYHPTHFDFVPTDRETFYYNENAWRVNYQDGHALYIKARSTSGLCAYRELLVEHYRKRVALVEQNGYSNRMGYEPGTHNRPERVDDYGCESWRSEWPNIDIRHANNWTPSRWKKSDFRNQKYTEGWTEADAVPGWYTDGKFGEMLDDIIAL